MNDATRGAIDRRTLIARAAAAGAVAWTTPVVIDSMASPAGALTGSGCVLGVWQISSPNPSGSACTSVLEPCDAPTLPADLGCAAVTMMSAVGQPSPPGLTLSRCQTSGSQTVATFQVATGCSIIGYAVVSPSCVSTLSVTAHSGTSLIVSFGKNSTRYVYVLATCP